MFVLAETIHGYTVDELSATMSLSERAEWKSYFDYKERQKKRVENKRNGNKPNSRRRPRPGAGR